MRTSLRGALSGVIAPPPSADLLAVPDLAKLPRRALVSLDPLFERGQPFAGEVLASEGEHARWAGFVVRGAVAEIAHGRHRRLIAGDSFGLADVLVRRPHRATVTAIDDASVLLIDRRHLTSAMAIAPEFGVSVARAIALDAGVEPTSSRSRRLERRRRTRPAALGWAS